LHDKLTFFFLFELHCATRPNVWLEHNSSSWSVAARILAVK